MIKATGVYRFEKFIDGKPAGVQEFHNLVTDLMFSKILRFFARSVDTSPQDANVLDISYFAFGTGTATPATTDTKLATEVFRKIYTIKSISGNSHTAVCSLGSGDANYSLTEVGIFSDGSITPDSGYLLSRALVTIEKNSNITYNVYYTLTLTEA